MGKVKQTPHPEKIRCTKTIIIDPCEWDLKGNYYTKEVLVSGANEQPVYITVQVGKKEWQDAKVFQS